MDHLEHLFYQGKWWGNRQLLTLNMLLILPLLTSYANGFDGSVHGLQSVDNWQDYFGRPRGGRLGLFNAIQNIGGLCGVLFAPYVADYLGRRKAIFIGAILLCAGVALQTASQGFSMFVGARWLIGFGTTFAQNASPLLISELAYPKHRPALVSIFNSLWFSGSIGTFRINNTWSWRIPSLLQGLPSVLQVFLIFLVPESPRWLIAKGRDEEAIRTLAKYHADGDVNSPLVQFEYNEIKEALRLEEEAQQAVSYLSLFSTAGNLRRMRVIIAIGFFSQWSGNGLISYYLSIILTNIGLVESWKQTLLNGFLQIWNITIAISASLLTERFGRRTLWLVSTAGMLLSYTFITVTAAVYRKTATWDDKGELTTPGDKNAGNAFVFFIFLFNGAYAIAYTPLLVSYTVEILPFQIRAKGLAIMNLSVTASLVFNQYINPIAWDALNWKYYVIYVAWDVFEFGFMWMYAIETKGRTLEECSLLFDGKDAQLQKAAEHDAAGTGPSNEKESIKEKEEAATSP
ncbi:hexose transporter [Auriculariales sp. MPI-PUGE-AT-0066]|nr:hexose transporter [Auriculariales sp. MPI-PUGE-AT-0066]